MPTKHTADIYATVAALLAADDLPQETLTVWGMQIRVRGLTLEERETARAKAKKYDGSEDMLSLYTQYFRYGVVQPPLNDEQARQLAQKHAGTVTQIGDLIHRLTELDHGVIAAAARALAGVGDGDEPGAAQSADTRKAA